MKITKLIRQASGCSKVTAQAIADACKTASLNSLSESQLTALGCKGSQAPRLLAAFRLGERVHTAQSAAEAPNTRHPADAAGEIRKRFDIGALEQEHFWCIALDARQKVLDVFTVAIGSLAQVDVHPRELFKPLVRMAAHSCILAHNHPSNDAEPSDADVQLTMRMCENGKMIGIPVLDHIVITADDYCSLSSLGLVSQ
jgi:DNA repair protein RadC